MGTLTAQNETDILSPRECEISQINGSLGLSARSSDFGNRHRAHSFSSLIQVRYLSILRFNSTGWARRDVSPPYVTYEDVRITYGEMEHVSRSWEDGSPKKRLCLPYAVSPLFQI